MRFIIILLMSQFAAAEDWLCTEESGVRMGNVIMACGIGESLNDEAFSRKKALQNAIEEFNTICEMSADCRGKKTIVEPKRTTCKTQINGLLKCYRLIHVTIEDNE